MAELLTVRVAVVERLRDTLVARALRGQLGRPVAIDQLVNAVLALLPPGITYDTVFESMRYLAGTVLEETEAVRLAWRLAGNLPLLRAGRAVSPWSSQQGDEWVPLQIMQLRKTTNAKGRPGFEVITRVLAGTAAPLKISSFWGMGTTKFVAFKVGFSRPWDKYPFRYAADLVGLRLYGMIEAARSRERPEFHEIDCPASMQKWNRDHILKLRLRVGVACPVGYTHACRVCAVGYDRCVAATHPATYTVGSCAGCGAESAPFDPLDPSPYCVDCATKARLKRKT